ncbi:hypothetical protein H8F27_03565 [Synechococcus sp. CBW1108]|nr:hypothetical protein H8F27_03565 [Synechococcus sp. CBW1108]
MPLALADLPACLDDLTGTMQILHNFPLGQPRVLAMVETPPAASAHHPPQQDNHRSNFLFSVPAP